MSHGNQSFFEAKSPWQERDCINRSMDYDCQNPSVLEAVCYGLGNAIARVRCCTDDRCKKVAAQQARSAVGSCS